MDGLNDSVAGRGWTSDENTDDAGDGSAVGLTFIADSLVKV
jgi:hypothetical protein